MKLRSLKNIFISTFFIAALCFLVFFAMPHAAVAEGADYGSVTVSYDGEKYVCSDDTGAIFSDASLQNVIDYAENAYSQTDFNFDSLNVTEPLVFKKHSLLQGALSFELNTNGYALTVSSRATLTLQGLVLNSNRSALRVNYNANLRIVSGTVRVTDCNTACSVIDVRGNTVISGGEIIYSSDNSAFGYGVSVNDGGNLTVSPEVNVPVRIEGYSALCMAAGYAEINGGEYIANRTGGDSSAGYSVDVQDGEIVINGGGFPSPINNRVLVGTKVTINGGSLSSMRVTPRQNKKINIGALEVSAGNYCELNIAFLENAVAISGKKSNQGFRTVGFNVAGENVDEPVLTVSTNQKKTVVPIEDNHYNVLLSCDGAVYETLRYTYGATVLLRNLPAPEKLGYTLSGWEEKYSDFPIYDDITLNAVTALCDTSIEITGTVLTYNGLEQTITPILSHDLPVSYTTYWERFIQSDWEKICDGNELNVTAVAQSGQYRFIVIAAYGDDESRTEKEVDVTINKGRYENITHSAFSGVYDPYKRLSGYALDSDFAWKDVTVIPTVPIKQYPAIYNADPANYEDCELFITIDLQKAAAVAAVPHRDLSGVYEKKMLKDYLLDDEFRWQSPEEIPVVKKTSYAALYNPDSENYEDTVCHIILRLAKGSYNDSKRLEDMTVAYRPNYYLSDFSGDLTRAHAHYRLKYTADAKLNAGSVELECIYNDDSDNYNDYVFAITLTVEKADINPEDVPQIAPFTGVYSGLPLSSYTLSDSVFWRNPELIPTVDVQEYDAFYNPDRENYNDYPITVSLVLEKGTYDENSVAVPTFDAITYDKDLTLANIALPEGWFWKDGTVNPTVAQDSYNAEYCADTVNYHPLAIIIHLTVNKADIPAAVLPDKTVTYNGNAHYLEFEYLPYPLELVEFENNGQVNAGKYEITAKLKQTDTDNYNLHPTTVRGYLIIQKAPSVITAPTRYDVLEGETLTITGTVENTEQNLIIPAFSETAVGVYHVTLTTAESSNYLAGSLSVTVSINRTEKYIGNMTYPANYDGSYLYGMLINSKIGVPNDAEISFRPFSHENYYMGIEISVTVDSNEYSGSFIAKIRMTDQMTSASAFKLFSEDGEEVAFHVENGVYLIFETDGNDIFYLQAEFNKKFAWYWIPIGIVLGLLVIGAVLVILWKKGIIKIKNNKTETFCADPETDKKATQKEKEAEPTEQEAQKTADDANTTVKEKNSEENIETK